MSERPCNPPIPPPCAPKGETSEKEKGTKENEKVKETQKRCFEALNFDPRFPNMNQTMRCWVNYVDYIRCQEKYGEDYKQCEVFKKVYMMMCPGFWIDEWDERRENGTLAMPRW